MPNTYNKFSTRWPYNHFNPSDRQEKNVIHIVRKLRSMYTHDVGYDIGLKVAKDLAEAMIEINALKAYNEKLEEAIIKSALEE